MTTPDNPMISIESRIESLADTISALCGSDQARHAVATAIECALDDGRPIRDWLGCILIPDDARYLVECLRRN